MTPLPSSSSLFHSQLTLACVISADFLQSLPVRTGALVHFSLLSSLSQVFFLLQVHSFCFSVEVLKTHFSECRVGGEKGVWDLVSAEQRGWAAACLVKCCAVLGTLSDQPVSPPPPPDWSPPWQRETAEVPLKHKTLHVEFYIFSPSAGK